MYIRNKNQLKFSTSNLVTSNQDSIKTVFFNSFKEESTPKETKSNNKSQTNDTVDSKTLNEKIIKLLIGDHPLLPISVIEKIAHCNLMIEYFNNKDFYNIKIINEIIHNESTHIVAEFKDYLIKGDYSEFLQQFYTKKESKKILPQIFEYYISCSVIYPNYVILPESKYIYKNIQKKQRVIDIQQEQEDKENDIKLGIFEEEREPTIFTTQAIDSILNQTNTSTVKKFFGMGKTVEGGMNDTQNIVDKINEAENNILVKNKKNDEKEKKIIDNSTNSFQSTYNDYYSTIQKKNDLNLNNIERNIQKLKKIIKNKYQNNDYGRELTKTNSQTYSNINYNHKTKQIVKSIHVKQNEKMRQKSKNNINNNNDQKKLISINTNSNNKTNKTKDKIKGRNKNQKHFIKNTSAYGTLSNIIKNYFEIPSNNHDLLTQKNTYNSNKLKVKQKKIIKKIYQNKNIKQKYVFKGYQTSRNNIENHPLMNLNSSITNFYPTRASSNKLRKRLDIDIDIKKNSINKLPKNPQYNKNLKKTLINGLFNSTKRINRKRSGVIIHNFNLNENNKTIDSNSINEIDNKNLGKEYIKNINKEKQEKNFPKNKRVFSSSNLDIHNNLFSGSASTNAMSINSYGTKGTKDFVLRKTKINKKNSSNLKIPNFPEKSSKCLEKTGKVNIKKNRNILNITQKLSKNLINGKNYNSNCPEKFLNSSPKNEFDNKKSEKNLFKETEKCPLSAREQHPKYKMNAEMIDLLANKIQRIRMALKEKSDKLSSSNKEILNKIPTFGRKDFNYYNSTSTKQFIVGGIKNKKIIKSRNKKIINSNKGNINALINVMRSNLGNCSKNKGRNNLINNTNDYEKMTKTFHKTQKSSTIVYNNNCSGGNTQRSCRNLYNSKIDNENGNGNKIIEQKPKTKKHSRCSSNFYNINNNYETCFHVELKIKNNNNNNVFKKNIINTKNINGNLNINFNNYTNNYNVNYNIKQQSNGINNNSLNNNSNIIIHKTILADKNTNKTNSQKIIVGNLVNKNVKENFKGIHINGFEKLITKKYNTRNFNAPMSVTERLKQTNFYSTGVISNNNTTNSNRYTKNNSKKKKIS